MVSISACACRIEAPAFNRATTASECMPNYRPVFRRPHRREFEPLGHHARYRERFVVHLDLPAYHAGVAPEPPFPPRVPDQRLPWPAAPVRASFHRCPTAGLTPSNPNRFTETRCPITSSAPSLPVTFTWCA